MMENIDVQVVTYEWYIVYIIIVIAIYKLFREKKLERHDTVRYFFHLILFCWFFFFYSILLLLKVGRCMCTYYSWRMANSEVLYLRRRYVTYL